MNPCIYNYPVEGYYWGAESPHTAPGGAPAAQGGRRLGALRGQRGCGGPARLPGLLGGSAPARRRGREPPHRRLERRCGRPEEKCQFSLAKHLFCAYSLLKELEREGCESERSGKGKAVGREENC